jgi:hypothetical protein
MKDNTLKKKPVGSVNMVATRAQRQLSVGARDLQSSQPAMTIVRRESMQALVLDRVMAEAEVLPGGAFNKPRELRKPEFHLEIVGAKSSSATRKSVYLDLDEYQ